MQGRLSPEEWKPILAASLIYYSKLNTRRILGLIIILAPIILAVSAGLLYLFGSLILIDFTQFELLELVAVVFITFAGVPSISWYEKRVWLGADRKAADYAGPRLMLEVLEKIKSFKIAEMEGGRLDRMPSLTQRIESLRRYVQAS